MTTAVTFASDIAKLPSWQAIEKDLIARHVLLGPWNNLNYTMSIFPGVMDNCGMCALSRPFVSLPNDVPLKGEFLEELGKDFADKMMRYADGFIKKSQYIFSDNLALDSGLGVGKLNWKDIVCHLAGAVTYGPVSANMFYTDHLIQTFIWIPKTTNAYSLGSVTEADGSVRLIPNPNNIPHKTLLKTQAVKAKTRDTL